MKIWSCKIGEIDGKLLPDCADGPMREAVEKAYYDLTWQHPKFNFSGWGSKLEESQRAVLEDREPHRYCFYCDEEVGPEIYPEDFHPECVVKAMIENYPEKFRNPEVF